MLKGVRRAQFSMPEAVEDEFCLLEVLEVVKGVG